ncbi:hypothetical protein HYW20_05590 [Candidatus Woesearchaeota archaeon]|nr:hypothetical protein [Candidatus Woesearchaeota archaeon]
MVKIKSVQQIVENYVMSSPIASIRYEKSMHNKGWEKPKEKSLKYALNLIKKSGLNKTEAINILEEVKNRTQEILLILHNNFKLKNGKN